MSLAQPNASPWVQDYTYNAVMRLSGVWSPAGTFSYNYATGGGDRVEAIDLPDSQGPWYGTSVEYDGLARPFYLQIFTPKTRFYDQYSYDDGSEVTQQVFTAGNYLNYTYDNIGQLKTALGHESGGTTPRLQEQFGYGYDKAWNLNSRTNYAMIQTFGVNDLNELTNSTVTGLATPVIAGATTSPATSVTVNGTTAKLYGDATFATTNVGLSSGWNTVTAMSHDGYGRVASSSIQVDVTGNATYMYDANGNLTNDGKRNFGYDDENELISVWVSSAWSNNFVYDGLQRKRIERDYSWQGGSWVETNEVHYVYDGNLVFQERDQNNLPITTYTRGADLSGTLQGAGGIGGLLARSDRMSVIPLILSPVNPRPQYVSTSYYHSDGNGNVTALVEPSGFQVASYEYDPYGNMLAMSGLLAGINHYRFSSKEWNDNDGLYYYLYRLYDPGLQRWPNKDPKDELGNKALHPVYVPRYMPQYLFNLLLREIEMRPALADATRGEMMSKPGSPTKIWAMNNFSAFGDSLSGNDQNLLNVLAGNSRNDNQSDEGDNSNLYAFVGNDPLAHFDPDGQRWADLKNGYCEYLCANLGWPLSNGYYWGVLIMANNCNYCSRSGWIYVGPVPTIIPYIYVFVPCPIVCI